jgi:hypothetical protein
MPTTDYTFDKLFGYQGEGTSSIDLTAGTSYTFNITNNTGSSYFVMETAQQPNLSVVPKNTSGSYTSLTNIASIVIGDYITGFALPTGTNSFVFTPATNVTGSTLRLRGTGGITLGITGGSLAETFITNAGITNPTEISAITTLVSELDTANLLTEFYAAYPHVGGTSTSNMYNLVNPENSDAAFRLSFSGGWTFASNGATPNGTNAYANTHLNPSVVFNNTDLATWGYFSRTNSGVVGEYVMGVANDLGGGNTEGGTQLIIRRDTNLSYALSDFSTVSYRGTQTTSINLGDGFFIGAQQGANIKLFRDGALRSLNIITTTGLNPPSRDVYLGAINASGTAVGFTDKRCVFSFISKKLTDAQIVTLNTIVQTFQTNLGR